MSVSSLPPTYWLYINVLAELCVECESRAVVSVCVGLFVVMIKLRLVHLYISPPAVNVLHLGPGDESKIIEIDIQNHHLT